MRKLTTICAYLGAFGVHLASLMAFEDVGELSDEDDTLKRRPLKRPWLGVKVVKPGATRLFKKPQPIFQPCGESSKPLQKHDMVGRARAITQGKCRCSKRRRAHNCFEPFRHPGKFNELIGHLRYLGHMDKMEVDKEANKLKSVAVSASHSTRKHHRDCSSVAGTCLCSPCVNLLVVTVWFGRHGEPCNMLMMGTRSRSCLYWVIPCVSAPSKACCVWVQGGSDGWSSLFVMQMNLAPWTCDIAARSFHRPWTLPSDSSCMISCITSAKR